MSIFVNNNLTISNNTTFAGTVGWTCANLICTVTPPVTITLQDSVTYTTTTSAQLTSGTNASRITMQSSSATVRAIWTLENTATQTLSYVNGTRIDSSGGQTVYTFGGTISTTPIGAETLNWSLLVAPGTVAYTFVN
jgi:hypothetical protein